MTAFIKTDETTCIIQADTLIIEPNEPHLFAYNGEKLVGIWRMADVRAAYLAEGRK